MSNPCAPTTIFPATLFNRPGLSRVKFRIGEYTDFRRQLLSELDGSPLLLSWTYRRSDDPGIALLDGAAILCDILTFYQEMYANEAWLSTAAWPESVTDLVQLLGYRPAPGIGGQTTAAFEFKGATTVTVPAGFALTAQIVGQTAPVNFETTAVFSAVPELSRIPLYPEFKVWTIQQGTNVLSVETDQLTGSGVTLKPKDRLALVDGKNLANPESPNWQIAVVDHTEVQADQTLIYLTGAWGGKTSPRDGLTAYKLGRTFNCFGHNAPANELSIDNAGKATTSAVNTTISLPGVLNAFPLDRTVNDLAVGGNAIVDLQITHAGATEEFLMVTEIFNAFPGADTVGPLSAGVTKVQLQDGYSHTGIPVTTDRRTAQLHEVIGQGFDVQGKRAFNDRSFGEIATLYYFGDGNVYQLLNGLALQFVALNADDSVDRVEYSTASIDPDQIGNPTEVKLRAIGLTPHLQLFHSADFAPNTANAIVFGNLVPVTQGKTQPAVVLGNGDARQLNQSFKVPKSPLTWLLDEELTPPREPELLVLVDGIAWTEVETFFLSGPKDRNFILRRDPNGDTWVQFGDGINGARLTSGIGNVTATYRTGVGASGWRIPGTKPSQASQALNLSAIRLYDEVTLGSDPETSDSARQAAPGRVQNLGRLVTLSDFEYEALALPGVIKAKATWSLTDGSAVLVMLVLLQHPSDPAVASIGKALSRANVDRGPQRFPVVTQRADFLYVYLHLKFGLTLGYQQSSVIDAIGSALGVMPKAGDPPEGGLFSQDQRNLGQEEYASRIEGVVQNVAGVDWVEVTAFDQLGLSADPTELIVPSITDRADRLLCPNNRLLTLFADQFLATPGGGA